MLDKIAAGIADLLAVVNGKKTWSGIISVATGGALYWMQKNGITPAEPGDTLKTLIDAAQTVLIDGGSLLALFGFGAKVGKARP